MQTYSNHFAKSRIETGNTVVLDGGTIILSNVAFAAATRENLGISDDPQMRLLAPLLMSRRLYRVMSVVPRLRHQLAKVR
jgi:hypothetical protein